jgi:hypothetical protein
MQVGLALSGEGLLVGALWGGQSFGRHRIVRRQNRSERVRRGNGCGWGVLRPGSAGEDGGF